MKISIYILLVVLLSSCANTRRQAALEKYSLTDKIDNYWVKPFTVSLDGSKIEATEYVLENKTTSFLTKVGFYNELGTWVRVLFDEGKRHPILVWEHRKILDDNENTFTLLADGVEDFDIIYSSVIILNEDNSDALNKNGANREELLQFIQTAQLRDDDRKQFYKKYWTFVDPKKAEKLGY